MSEKIKVLVVGCGNMGHSHALAYNRIKEYEIIGLVSRAEDSKPRSELADKLGGVAQFDEFYEALRASCPDVVSINTYPDSHAEFAMAALNAGCHVFVEKPLASNVEDALAIVKKACQVNKKVVVGYILKHHPAWIKFVELSQTLGKPLVMRMNLNQQSTGKNWEKHKNVMRTVPPIVDCGVHYVDIMCSMTKACPVRVQAIGARLSNDLEPGMYNYGNLQVVFEDGSVGWYEAGWGPMMSETAHFIKDVVGPKGAISFSKGLSNDKSDKIASHVKAEKILIHHSEIDSENNLTRPDEIIDIADEAEHDDLCENEQRFLLCAIKENLDLTEHLGAAVNSLKIVLAADESIRTGQTIQLQ